MSLTRSLIPQQHRPILDQLLVRLSLRQGQLWNVEPDWLMEQLLAIMAAGYAPNDIYSVVDKLSKMDVEKIDRVVEVLSALVSSPHVNRLTLMVQPGPMRKMLVAGKASGVPKTRSLVANIVNILASKGDDSYMDLLD